MSGCGKIAFASRAAANEHARTAVKAKTVPGARKGGARKMRAYTCPRCGQWHLTSLSKTEQRRRGYA